MKGKASNGLLSGSWRGDKMMSRDGTAAVTVATNAMTSAPMDLTDSTVMFATCCALLLVHQGVKDDNLKAPE
ncbi:hypothetical protein RRG08_004177 [Elysia crispata]|uniref:Uncharacterized protein n=1 Tax=Elysia crispata TaxID=231223 RepID=A0AAE1D5R3_9GAST|nr:hypothetical protein RRG08_004177 [Elysia crispata]